MHDTAFAGSKNLKVRVPGALGVRTLSGPYVWGWGFAMPQSPKHQHSKTVQGLGPMGLLGLYKNFLIIIRLEVYYACKGCKA